MIPVGLIMHLQDFKDWWILYSGPSLEDLGWYFDDILIYSKPLEVHVHHVDMVLKLLEEKQLYAKNSKCDFGVQEVEYLGHIVCHEVI